MNIEEHESFNKEVETEQTDLVRNNHDDDEDEYNSEDQEERSNNTTDGENSPNLRRGLTSVPAFQQKGFFPKSNRYEEKEKNRSLLSVPAHQHQEFFPDSARYSPNNVKSLENVPGYQKEGFRQIQGKQPEQKRRRRRNSIGEWIREKRRASKTKPVVDEPEEDEVSLQELSPRHGRRSQLYGELLARAIAFIIFPMLWIADVVRLIWATGPRPTLRMFSRPRAFMKWGYGTWKIVWNQPTQVRFDALLTMIESNPLIKLINKLERQEEEEAPIKE